MARFKYNNSLDDSADVDMTPMLDIVFIMLIFFIVTAVFIDESGLDFTIPPDGNTTTQTGSTIQIFVDHKNNVSVDRVRVTLKGVSAQVERLLAEKPDANVLLLASSKAALDPVVQIKDQMNLAGRPTLLKIVRE